jgi:tetratricopeptide (TPR) repeat protein
MLDQAEVLLAQAGDFYLAQSDFARAENFYKHALQSGKSKLETFEMSRGSGDVKFKLDLVKSIAEITVKTARLDEVRNKPLEAEAKYSEAVNFAVSKLGELHFFTAGFLIHQADFYTRRNDFDKAREIYNKADSVLDNPESLSASKQQSADELVFTATALQIQVQKKLGDINRDNAKIAARNYREAHGWLNKYESVISRIQGKTGATDHTQYFEDGEFTAEYFADKIEILEALVKLNAFEPIVTIKAELTKTQKNVKDLKEKSCR